MTATDKPSVRDFEEEMRRHNESMPVCLACKMGDHSNCIFDMVIDYCPCGDNEHKPSGDTQS